MVFYWDFYTGGIWPLETDFPGTPNDVNRVPVRGRDAELALSGPRGGAVSLMGKMAGFGPLASNLDSGVRRNDE